jgi:D-sedoheptulose 7-phosphate isomerase
VYYMKMITNQMSFSNYIDEHLHIINNLNLSEIESTSAILRELLEKNGTLWVAGNGGSSTTAAHASADFTKTIRKENKSLRTFSLSDFVALNSAYSNDVSFEENYSESIQALAKPGDALLLISVSGLSENLLNCFYTAKKMNLKTISWVGERGAKVFGDSDSGVLVPSDDYQIVENVHLILMHWFTKEFLAR